MTTERLHEWIEDQFATLKSGVPITYIRIETEDELVDTLFISSEDSDPASVIAKIEKRLANILPGLRVGQHALKLVSCADSTPVSTHRHIVSGAAPTPKKAPPIEDSLGRLAVTLTGLTEGLAKTVQEFAERAHSVRSDGMANEARQHEILLQLNDQLFELKNDAENKAARREMLLAIGQQCAPVAGQLLSAGLAFLVEKHAQIAAANRAREAEQAKADALAKVPPARKRSKKPPTEKAAT